MGKLVVIDITWLRPLKLIGIMNVLCALLCFIFSLALKDWVISDEKKKYQFYMGLWEQCQKPSKNLPQTSEIEDEFFCQASGVFAGYMGIIQLLMVVSFLAAIAALVVSLIAYYKREKRFFFKIAAGILIVAAALVLVSVIILPVKFVIKLPFSSFFWFGWGYGLAWAAMCFMTTAAVLFLCSSETKEIYHKQKQIEI